MTKTVKVIGGGLAGSEAALYLASHGIFVELTDIKPAAMTPCHHSGNFAELVCSNSLKSNDVYGNACGLLKEEMRLLGSAVIDAADRSKVPAGNALAVNRELFSSIITEKIQNNENIEVKVGEATNVDGDGYRIIATGPLTTAPLAKSIENYLGECPYFFDTAAPIVSFESIDMENAFTEDRYGTPGEGDYINCPLSEEEYDEFYDALINAERAKLHDFEDDKVFDGCMPIEVMAARGKDTLRFGPMKPMGLTDPRTNRRPYACVQLRKENVAGDAYNIVGFQTNLLFSEQKRVFSSIPALKNAEYYRYGVMHKNTFIHSPGKLNYDFSCIKDPTLFFAGQMTGVEGYVESAASGLIAAINILKRLEGKEPIRLGSETVIGALAEYIAAENDNFQPMNANYGILSPLEKNIRDKKERKKKMAERSLSIIKKFKEDNRL